MTLGERMKGYEKLYQQRLLPGTPTVIRLDMRAGHAFCRDLERPFDETFADAMRYAAADMCMQITGAVLAYTQSDEISIVLQHTVDEREHQQFFAGRVSKIVSVTASMCTLVFNSEFDFRDYRHPNLHWTAQFDSRVFNLPNLQELHNYLVWRQKDAERNSINMAARAFYSPQELHGKKRADLHDMLMAKGVNWNNLPDNQKRGTTIFKRYEGNRTVWDSGTPCFTQEPDLIARLFENEETKS